MPETKRKPSPAAARWLPFSMMILGVGLILTTLVLLLVLPMQGGIRAAPLPDKIAGLDLTQKLTGEAASGDITRLHGKSFSITSGSKAVYGPAGEVTLWVAGTGSDAETRQMLVDMRDRIAEGRSPFQPIGEIPDGSRVVYALDGMGQRHYYFQSGRYLIWLAASPELVDLALSQTLAFYR